MSPRVVFVSKDGKIPESNNDFLEKLINKFVLYTKDDLVGYREVSSIEKHIKRLRGNTASEQYLMDTLKWYCYIVQIIISTMKCHISTDRYEVPVNCVFKDITAEDVITFEIENDDNSEWIGDIVIC